MISIIAAIGKNGELGKNNSLIWKLPKDLQFFKDTTSNHKVIMGYNTFISIGKALPNRENVVLVDDIVKMRNRNVKVYDDIDKLIVEELNNTNENFIIGGASLYNYFYKMCDRMYLTLIDAEDSAADTYFPKIDLDEWKQTELYVNEDNGINYRHVLFERVKNE